MAKGKGKGRKIKASQLRAAGYRYKLDELTPAELDEWQHGKKVVIKGKERRAESTDYDYFYKAMRMVNVPGDEEPPVIVKIYHVNRDFYYQGVKLRSVDQLPIIEEMAVRNSQYEKLDKRMQDTKPSIVLNEISVENAPTNVDGSTVISYAASLKTTSKLPDIITLTGGPLDGHTAAWNIKLPFFMTQYEYYITQPEPGTPGVRTVRAVRYKRDPDNKNVYNFDNTLNV
jgi:hypothetical protein